MADEYIRKEDASDAVIKHLQLDYEYAWGAREAINALPSADVVQVKHGKWYHSECDKFKCGLCGYAFTVIQGADRMRFCPNCGAKMYGEEWQDE